MKPANSIPTITVSCGIGAGERGTESGPQTFVASAHCPKTLQHDHSVHTTSFDCKQSEIIRICEELATWTHEQVTREKRFCVLGGDHSIAMGTWSGVAKALGNQKLGLLWFDAHCDAHTHDTTPTGNIHGMPVAALLGHGRRELTHIFQHCPSIQPEHVILIGIRDYEAEEYALLKSLGVTVHTMKDVHQQGFSALFKQSIDRLKQDTDHYGLSIDLDGLDPMFVPGVGTPVDDGVGLGDLITMLAHCHADKQCLGAEFVEYNPELDHLQQTAITLSQLINALYSGISTN